MDELWAGYSRSVSSSLSPTPALFPLFLVSWPWITIPHSPQFDLDSNLPLCFSSRDSAITRGALLGVLLANVGCDLGSLHAMRLPCAHFNSFRDSGILRPSLDLILLPLSAHHWLLACILSLNIGMCHCPPPSSSSRSRSSLAFCFKFYSIPLAVVMLCDPLPVGMMLLPTIVWSAAHETWWQVRARSNHDTVSSAITFRWGVFAESEFT
jgi:hypothetical protein